jgi:SAM-dependent methyltransferase
MEDQMRETDKRILTKTYSTQRPEYPSDIVSFLKEHCAVDESWQIADIGSGAGISTRLLSRGLKRRIYAVEPNDELRAFAEENESGNLYFKSIKGTAEKTTLADCSVNLVCAFQSFQLFDGERSRNEFYRILRSPKRILIAFSERTMDQTGFYGMYENILTQFPEYSRAMRHNPTLDEVKEFLGNQSVVSRRFFRNLRLDWNALEKRFASAYYTPKEGTTEYNQAIPKLKSAFAACVHNGNIEICYETVVYLGVLI